MSTEPLPPSDEPTPDAEADASQGDFKTLRSAQNLHEPDLDFDPLDEFNEQLEEVPQEGQPPMAEGEQAPHRVDDSVLPKATMPVELAPKPESPAAPGVQSADAELSQSASLAEPSVDATSGQAAAATDTPPGLAAWLRSLSVVEKLCCLLILAGVLVFGITVFVPNLYDFSGDAEMLEDGDFPVKGQHVEVKSASTHWRKPVLEGADVDTVRPGTVYVPEVMLTLSGKGNIRILFRSSDGSLVGDPVALELQGDQEFSATSTVGLNEAGDFAAQRTGLADLWSVEFHEAAAGAEAVADYTLLFKMKISPLEK